MIKKIKNAKSHKFALGGNPKDYIVSPDDSAYGDLLNAIYSTPNPKATLSDGLNALQGISTAVKAFDAANDIIYNYETPLNEDPIFDVAQRGTAADRHVANQLADLFLTGNGLWGESSRERELKEGITHAQDIAYKLGNKFNNVKNNFNLKNSWNANEMPNLLSTEFNPDDTGWSAYVASEINPILQQGANDYVTGFYNQVGINNQRQLRNNMRNYYAEGGNLEGFNGVIKVNEGGTHGQNPYDGVTMGIAPDGIPNKVEEGEVVYKDYVYSNRLKPSKTLLKNSVLPEKYEGLTYAKIAEKLQKESEDRPNDSISIRTLNEMMSRLMSAQEEQKAKIEERRLAKVIDEMPTEDKAALVASLIQQNQPQYDIGNLGQMPQQPMQEVPQEVLGIQEPSMDLSQPMYANGGKIYIKPSKRGTFTAAAKKRGMGVQEFASKVLANKENYSPAMVKKANFAKNAAKWKHADGGYLFPWGGWTNQDELNDYYTQQYTNFWNNLQGRKGSNVNRAYLTGAQARQWVNMLSQGDEKQKALADMLKNQWGDNLDWSENADWEFRNKYNPNGTVTESNPYLEWAGDNTAMKDALWGIRHVPQLSVDNRYLNTEGNRDVTTYNWLVKDGSLSNPVYIFGVPQAPLRQIETRTDVGNNTANNYYTIDSPWTPEVTRNLQGPVSTSTSTTTNTTTTNNNTNTVTPDREVKLPRNPEWFRYIPLLGGLGALFQSPNYTYANQLRELAGQYNPIAAPYIGGYRRYNPYDVNLGDAENIALTAAALNANRGQGRATQGALNAATIGAAQRTAAQRNLAWQQANEENRLNTDTYNLGIDRTNLATTQAYDQLNQEINNRRINMLQAAAAAQDASQTAWANALSNNVTNSLNNLGNLGRENWAANQRNALIELLGSDALAEALGLI